MIPSYLLPQYSILQIQPCKIYFQVPYCGAQKSPGVQWIKAM